MSMPAHYRTPLRGALRLVDALPADTSARILRVANDADVLSLDLQDAEVIELQFPQFTDGRAFSQAVLLRRRRGFGGDLRATGDVLIDQLQQMARVGFSSAVLRADQSRAAGLAQLARFEDFYQGDAQSPVPRFQRTRA